HVVLLSGALRGRGRGFLQGGGGRHDAAARLDVPLDRLAAGRPRVRAGRVLWGRSLPAHAHPLGPAPSPQGLDAAQPRSPLPASQRAAERGADDAATGDRALPGVAWAYALWNRANR